MRGFKTRFHLYTVPGQVFYDASRKLILKGVDGVIFVADSQDERMDANLESLDNLVRSTSRPGLRPQHDPLRAAAQQARPAQRGVPVEEMKKPAAAARRARGRGRGRARARASSRR